MSTPIPTRIEREADAFAEAGADTITGHYYTYSDLFKGYVTGAQAATDRAAPVVKALEELIKEIYSGGNHALSIAQNAKQILETYKNDNV